MLSNIGIPSEFGLDQHGFYNVNNIYWNLPAAALVELAVCRKEGEISYDGSIIARTGEHTGRSPNDKFIVRYPEKDDPDMWWEKANQPITPENYHKLYTKMISYYQGRDIFVQDMKVGAHPDLNLPVRIITEKAWHNLFARNLFLPTTEEEARKQRPVFTIIQSENFQANPAEDGTRTGTFVVINFEEGVILIGGTGYAGEIKKSVFTIMNYLMPKKGILSMHCSANVGKKGDVALFFGLSGTGKTTLSSDPHRGLIGDDEHGWADDGIFNFEGGCYAKTIRLSKEYEPMIWSATNRFGTVLENVVFDPSTRKVDFDSDAITENTRSAYPIEYINNYVPEGNAGHPQNIFFLTADAFGVLPPIARLDHEQAMYYFLSGYTSKLAGTETGLGQEPQATFSTCFGAPFLPLKPHVYSELLGRKISERKANVWLVNTGWTGGPYGIGTRFKLPYTRAIIHAALDGILENVNFSQEKYFGLWIPDECPGVPSELLNPQSTWEDKNSYCLQAESLVDKFEKNFNRFKDKVSAGVTACGPHH